MVVACPLLGGRGVSRCGWQAATMFEQDVKPVQVAHELRVSTKSAYQWRRRWRAGGDHGAGVQGRRRGSMPAVGGAAGPAAC